MREFKFRVFYPEYGQSQKPTMLYSKDYPTHGDLLMIAESDLLVLGPGSLMIMQYTGLKDKNGIEIFEDDIIEVANGDNNPICKVEWLLGQWCLMDEIGGSWTRQLYHQPDRLEIKGNIFEHKHLLEK